MRGTSLTAAVAVMVAIGAGFAGTAAALEEKKDEKVRLKACELNLCTLVTRKAPETGDFACSLTKTWSKAKLKEGSSTGKIQWGFGDAQCAVDLKLPRATVVAALKNPEHTLQFDEHTVTCVIEGDKEPTKVTAKLSPKVQFKGGQATKVWINLKDVRVRLRTKHWHSPPPSSRTVSACSTARWSSRSTICSPKSVRRWRPAAEAFPGLPLFSHCGALLLWSFRRAWVSCLRECRT